MVNPAQELSIFARRMKTARDKLGISQVELGVRAGIDEFSASARINQYERGKHTPDFLTATHLARVLEVPTAYLYTEDELLAEIILQYSQMSGDKRVDLLQSAKSLLIAPL